MNRSQNPNIMIDIETLGTGPNSIIATIGAMKFDRTRSLKPLEEMTSFYYRIDFESCNSLGMVSEEETVKWWDNQDEKSREEIYGEENRVPIKQALQELSEFIGNNPYTTVWAQGPHFDCTILENAYKKCNLRVPWAFWNVRDCRTLFDIANLRLKNNPGDYPHHSLYDCYKQVKGVKLALSFISVD